MTLSLPTLKGMENEEVFTYIAAINITKDIRKKTIVLHLLGPDVQEMLENVPTTDDEDNWYETIKLLELQPGW